MRPSTMLAMGVSGCVMLISSLALVWGNTTQAMPETQQIVYVTPTATLQPSVTAMLALRSATATMTITSPAIATNSTSPTPTAVVPPVTNSPTAPPPPTATATHTPTTAPVASPTAAFPLQSYTIQSGDTLFAIAARHRSTVALIEQQNAALDATRLGIGDVIDIPIPPPEEPTPYYPTAQTESTVIGYSAGGYPLESYQFGDGSQQVVFVGALHGGYEWNTALLAYRAIDYFAVTPDAVPVGVTIHIIPVANPDGLLAVTGSIGRFHADDASSNLRLGRTNANGVDLNRNWDCSWQADAEWYYGAISGGSAPFSEPEVQAMRDFFLQQTKLEAVVFWHSQATLVIPGGCGSPHPLAQQLADLYGAAAGYPVDAWTEYVVTGDVTDWLATMDIPAITVELKNHYDLDWQQNLAAMQAVLAQFSAETTCLNCDTIR